MLIRNAVIEDIENLIQFDRHISPKELENLVDLGRVYIAEENNTFIGWLRYNLFWDNTPFMNMLFVLDEYRGRGFGQKMVEHWELQMKLAGYEVLMTSTASDEYAQHFYNKIGYSAIGGFTILDDPYEIIMSKIIKDKQYKMSVNGTDYEVVKLLGHGKGGYSYLAQRDGRQYVLKQIHHEPCSYYTFGNKIEAEQNDYSRLEATGIRIPKLFDIDIASERILKEYVEGPTIYELVKADLMNDIYLNQVREMAEQTKACGLNIDYFPTNFVVQEDLIYYIDYECNGYMEEWNFENWGIKYWSKTQEFMEYEKQHSN